MVKEYKGQKKRRGTKGGKNVHAQAVFKIGSTAILPNPAHPVQKKQYHGQEVQQVKTEMVGLLLLLKKEVHAGRSQQEQAHAEQKSSPLAQQVTDCGYAVTAVLLVLVDLRKRVQGANQQA
jgi:hypothetical protein